LISVFAPPAYKGCSFNLSQANIIASAATSRSPLLHCPGLYGFYFMNAHPYSKNRNP
jgi:hypothetical protein